MTARLQLRVPQGQPIVHSAPAESTLREVVEHVKRETGMESVTLTSTFPRYVLSHHCAFDISRRRPQRGNDEFMLSPSSGLTITFPHCRKTFTDAELDQDLKSAGLVPSAVLIVS